VYKKDKLKDKDQNDYHTTKDNICNDSQENDKTKTKKKERRMKSSEFCSIDKSNGKFSTSQLLTKHITNSNSMRKSEFARSLLIGNVIRKDRSTELGTSLFSDDSKTHLASSFLCRQFSERSNAHPVFGSVLKNPSIDNLAILSKDKKRKSQIDSLKTVIESRRKSFNQVQAQTITGPHSLFGRSPNFKRSFIEEPKKSPEKLKILSSSSLKHRPEEEDLKHPLRIRRKSSFEQKRKRSLPDSPIVPLKFKAVSIAHF
jgi:hypothetical protein